jgi:hypothetical protein
VEFITPTEVESGGTLDSSQQNIVVDFTQSFKSLCELVSEGETEDPSVGSLPVKPVSYFEIRFQGAERFGDLDG